MKNIPTRLLVALTFFLAVIAISQIDWSAPVLAQDELKAADAFYQEYMSRLESLKDRESLEATSTSMPPFCLTGYANWDHSNSYKADNEWQTDFIALKPSTISDPVREFFIDVNGDGLLDYIYHYNYYGYGRWVIHSCVYLNNGSGWDSTYKCLANGEDSTGIFDFYGDCADMSQ